MGNLKILIYIIGNIKYTNYKRSGLSSVDFSNLPHNIINHEKQSKMISIDSIWPLVHLDPYTLD